MPEELALSDAAPDPAELTEIRDLPTDELRSELSRSLELTARHLTRLALIVRTLEERGEDLSELRMGFLGYLRQIAYGSVLPEVVVRYAEVPMLVRAIGSLPVPDQRKLARGEPVPLVVPKPGGGYDLRMADPLRMPREHVHQVFATGRVRDEAEQILLLESRARTPDGTPAPRQVGRVKPDRKRGGLVVGRIFVPASQVVEALAQLHDPTIPEEGDAESPALTQQVVARMTEDEHERFRIAAARARVSLSGLARRALIVLGLLSGE